MCRGFSSLAPEAQVGLVSDCSRRKHDNHHSEWPGTERGESGLFVSPALSVFSGLSWAMKMSQAGLSWGKRCQCSWLHPRRFLPGEDLPLDLQSQRNRSSCVCSGVVGMFNSILSSVRTAGGGEECAGVIWKPRLDDGQN